MRKALLVVLILSSALSWAQGGCRDKELNGQTTGGFLKAVGSASIRVCTDTASPCTLATIFSDAALTQSLTNPISMTGSGNYYWCAAAGQYNEQISSPGNAFATLNNTPVTISGSGDVTRTGNNTFSGSNAHTGDEKFNDIKIGAGPFIDARFYGCVDDGTTDNSTCIKSASNASATLDIPVIFPSKIGSCYMFSSQVLLKAGTMWGTNGLDTPNGSGSLCWGGSVNTHAVAQEANSLTTDTSKISIIGIRLTNNNASPGTGDGFHFERTVNRFNFENNHTSGFHNNLYFGSQAGTSSDVGIIRNNWTTLFGNAGIVLERLNNNIEVSHTICDSTSPSTGTACIYADGMGISPCPAEISIRDTKGEINNGAHLIWLDGTYGCVHVDGAIMRGNPTFNGLGGDTIHITQSEGSAIKLDNIVGGPVCTNIINNVQRGKAIACTSSGPRITSWVGGVDCRYTNTGFKRCGSIFSSDANDNTEVWTGRALAASGSTVDNTAASGGTSPLQKGTTAGLPAACTVGQLYFASDATNTKVIYACTTTNTWTQQAPASTSTPAIITAWATGACTASATLYLFRAGNVASQACTQTSYQVAGTTIIGSAGTLKNLRIISATNGVGTGDGVYTVRINNVATSITCTTNASNVCNDSVDTAAVVAGDLVSITLTTIAATTITNVNASVEKQ